MPLHPVKYRELFAWKILTQPQWIWPGALRLANSLRTFKSGYARALPHSLMRLVKSPWSAAYGCQKVTQAFAWHSASGGLQRWPNQQTHPRAGRVASPPAPHWMLFFRVAHGTPGTTCKTRHKAPASFVWRCSTPPNLTTAKAYHQGRLAETLDTFSNSFVNALKASSGSR